MHKYYIAAVEFPTIALALLLIWDGFGLSSWMGLEALLGLFLAFVGFELHLIYHRKEREENQQKRCEKAAKIKPDPAHKGKA
ncbi:MAG: hypothetical protein PHU99_02745 [Candidatus Cloacimonetes bacterium]|jgi:hypothetical protein|nr:hypothetical protein [Candidatus Cloacimonadota bacterium]MDY0337240.1 hypothetical protein [Candidatus Cloacimonadaceae bacterium]MCB5270006.1 hypothetical protein [Candidatus Cloacimonadota bacterium]MCK9334299.1 hypothetical protein [Candidatus Cloacimonadota bacterium]MDD2544289.1 hypothetical protein [Candidatus Cloacimonadota bacterium]